MAYRETRPRDQETTKKSHLQLCKAQEAQHMSQIPVLIKRFKNDSACVSDYIFEIS